MAASNSGTFGLAQTEMGDWSADSDVASSRLSGEGEATKTQDFRTVKIHFSSSQR